MKDRYGQPVTDDQFEAIVKAGLCWECHEGDGTAGVAFQAPDGRTVFVSRWEDRGLPESTNPGDWEAAELIRYLILGHKRIRADVAAEAESFYDTWAESVPHRRGQFAAFLDGWTAALMVRESETDLLLERWDETSKELQRQIVAEMGKKIAGLDVAADALVAAYASYSLIDVPAGGGIEAARDGVRNALALIGRFRINYDRNVPPQVMAERRRCLALARLRGHYPDDEIERAIEKGTTASDFPNHDAPG